MTLDSLEVALRAVPQKCPSCDFVFSAKMVLHVCPFPGLAPDYQALAAAVRKWMRERMPHRSTIEDWRCLPVIPSTLEVYNIALADVAKALGLEDTP